MIEHVQSNLDKHYDHFYELILGDSAKKDTQKKIQSILNKHQKESVELAILHPPYFDIIQFTEDKNDLSNAKTLSEFLQMFSRAVKTATSVLKDTKIFRSSYRRCI